MMLPQCGDTAAAVSSSMSKRHGMSAPNDVTLDSSDCSTSSQVTLRRRTKSGLGSMLFWALTVLCISAFSRLALAQEGNSDSGKNGGTYPLDLKNIFISHGTLKPAFAPDVLSYTVDLLHAHDTIAVTPEVDQSRPEYQGANGSNLPLVSIQWPNGAADGKPETASAAIRRDVDLPDDGSSMTITIVVQNPKNVDQSMSYTLNIQQSSDEPLVLLKTLEATDNIGNPVSVEPAVTRADVVYTAYVSPDADYIDLKVSCASPNWLKINGVEQMNAGVLSVPREKDHYRQVIQIECGSGSSSRNYVLSVIATYPEDKIKTPRLVVSGRGKDCSFEVDHFQCPNPHSKDYKAKLIGFTDPSIRYTVESSDESVEVRLLDQVPTIPFSYSGVGSLSVVAQAGQHNATWPLTFNGAPTPGIMRIIGWLLGLKLLALLISLLAVLGLSNTYGIGTPIGVTEIATAMTLLLQFFCFSSALRGTSILTDMTEAMKWVTLFWPVPWSSKQQSRTFAVWGDVSDLRNAYGCLFWSLIIFLVFMAVHGAIVARLKCSPVRSTVPHRLSFGNWESRCIHWLAFPVATASGMILSHDEATVGWKVAAGCACAFYVGWISTTFATVKTAVSSRKVVWVWQSSAREDGELEDEAGYWCDLNCDQLLTQPVNRSLFQWFFPWRWVSTVADINPVNICPRFFARRGDAEDQHLYPVNEFHRPHKESDYPLGKNPKSVDVIQTILPANLCPGHRLVAGLLRTQWLDILLTYEGLTKFFTNASAERDFTIPLTVKTCQLTGPITGGPNHFFYDGTRVPFIRIGDGVFRILIGLFMGLTLASESYTLDAVMFGIIAALAVALLAYHLIGWPYSRRIENWVLGALLSSIALVASAYMGYSIRKSRPSVLADATLWLSAITSFLLSCYACLVIFSLYSALVCPPLEETRFLENLANCHVTIADHDSGWSVDVPAYNKVGARDLKAQCSIVGAGDKVHVSFYPSGEDGTLEFDCHEILDACQSGNLNTPVLCLFCPDKKSPLGYRHCNVYERGSIHADIAGFLAMDRQTRHLADGVARNIAHQVDKGGRGKAIVCLTVIPASNTLTNLGSTDDNFSSSGGVVSSARESRGRTGRSRRGARSDGYSQLELAER